MTSRFIAKGQADAKRDELIKLSCAVFGILEEDDLFCVSWMKPDSVNVYCSKFFFDQNIVEDKKETVGYSRGHLDSIIQNNVILEREYNLALDCLSDTLDCSYNCPAENECETVGVNRKKCVKCLGNFFSKAAQK